MLPKVKTIERTCSACPSQWDITLEDGQYVYVRYRWSNFSAEIYENEKAYWTKKQRNYLVQMPGNGTPDGFMSNKEMVERLKNYLDFSNVKITDTYGISYYE